MSGPSLTRTIALSSAFSLPVLLVWLRSRSSKPYNEVSASELFRLLPKIELHAHLHGCIRESTIEDLLEQEALEKLQESLKTETPPSTTNASVASSPATSHDAQTVEMLSTMQELKSSDKPAWQYVENVQQQFRDQQKQNPPPLAKGVSSGHIHSDNHVDTFKRGDRTLEECFTVFALLHRLVQSPAVIRRITREAVMDFAAENVVYLELRSTPRPLIKNGVTVFTKSDYVQCVLDTIQETVQFLKHSITVRLILSIDRSGSLEEALDTVNVARTFLGKGVVGIDFSGNPHKKSFVDFLSAFELARSYGLKTTVHCAEIVPNDDDTFNILKFHPERLGHAVCLSEKVEAALFALPSPIPIEICPTSNIKTRCCSAFDQHPFGDFYRAGYPVSFCTDDSGVFSVTLSSETEHMARAFKLSLPDVFGLYFRAVEFIFDDGVKSDIRKRFSEWKQAHARLFS